MSHRNRKNNEPIGFLSPIRLVFFLVVGFSLLLTHFLWMGERCSSLGKEMKKLEVENRDLYRKRLYQESRWADMRIPSEMEKALRKHNIVMTWPTKDQIVNLTFSDVLASLREDRVPEIASQYAHAGGRAGINE